MVFILVLVSVIGPSITSATVVIGIMGWPGFARQLYGSVLSVREKEYIEGARAIGTKNFAIMFRYILPNAFSGHGCAGTRGFLGKYAVCGTVSFHYCHKAMDVGSAWSMPVSNCT